MSLSTGTALRLSEVAAAIGGTLRGNPDATVTAMAPLDLAGAGDLSFLANKKYNEQLASSGATAVLIAPDLADVPGAVANRIIVAKPHEAMLALLPRLYRMPTKPFAGVHPTAIVDPTAVVASDACVEAFAVVGADVRIGAGSWIGSHTVIGEGATVGAQTRLLPQVTLYPGVTIGDRCIIHSGARIGGDGYGYVFTGSAHQKIPQVGGCVIGHDVEIGANTAIDRGSIGPTQIGDGTKIDNLVHIAHNVRIGKLCLIIAQVGIAGSTHIGDGVTLAGQVGVSGHLKIGSRATLTAQAGVISDVPDGETWGSFPARPHKQAMREHVAVGRLPDLLKRIERLLRGQDADGGASA